MKKTVKAWVLLKNGEFFDTTTAYFKVTKEDKKEGFGLFPCTITYEIPKRKGVRK